MKKIELIVIGFIIIATLTLGWIMVGSTKKKTPKKTPAITAPPAPAIPKEEVLPVRVVKAQTQDFEDMLPVLGTVKGYLEIPLKFETNGVIKTLAVREADRVKKGDLIAMLEDTDAQLRIQYAKKKLESAQAQAQSAGKKKEIYDGLYKAGAIIKQKLEEATLEAEAVKSQVGMAEAEIKLAEAERNKTILLSPKEGIIGSKDVEAGEFVTPQNKIVSLFDLDKVYAELGVVEKDIEKVKIGQKVEVQLDSYPAEAFVGKIENILPIIEGRSRTLTAKVLLDNPKGLLLPGMFSRAKIYLSEIKDAIFVPKASVLTIGPGVNVSPIVNTGKHKPADIEKGVELGVVELRKITLGYSTMDYTQVTEGLGPGDLVIIEAKGELKEGLKVKVVGVEEPLM